MKLRTRFALYFHTLRYLKPVQVWGRVAFRLRSPRPDLRPAPSPRGLVTGWCPPVPREQSQLAEGRFRFLNVEHEIDSAADWNSQAIEKLWLYNLHYFDDLTDLALLAAAGFMTAAQAQPDAAATDAAKAAAPQAAPAAQAVPAAGPDPGRDTRRTT